MKKSSLLLILVLCLFLTQTGISAAASSTYEDYAESLADLGVFVGTGSGFELDRAPTRIEGLVMLIRLLGVEEEAKAMQGAELPFNDVPKWASGYVAYAYENGLTNGLNKVQFGSTNKMDAKAFMTFLLRSLGYNDQAGDFSYNNALSYAQSIDLVNDNLYSTMNNTTFLRAFIAKTAYDALNFPYKGGDVTLIDKLMTEGKIDAATGAVFKKTVLSEPESMTVVESGSVDLEDNLESVVMLECYGNYSDDYGPGTGSGVILSSDGRIITNYHVIEGSYDIDVVFNDESVYNGNVYVEAYDEELDLAILKIDKTGLRPATLGTLDNVKAGASVITIGSPYGYLNTVTEGIVSAIRSDSVQISAAINPGNSGGGLFDKNGKLIGITTAVLYPAENMGFAIPVEKLVSISGNQHISISTFFARTTDPLPAAPTGLSVLYETETAAFMKWNPVAKAESYDIYYKEEGDEEYYYLDSVYGQTSYGYLAFDLEPGVKYDFIVTAWVEDLESNMSTAVTFVKSNGVYKRTAFNPYYAAFSEIPDVGKLQGITPIKTEANKYYYEFGGFTDFVYDDIIYMLTEKGFYLDNTLSSSDSTVTDTYINEALNEKVIFSAKWKTDDKYYLTVEIIK